MTIQKQLSTFLLAFAATCSVSAADDSINFSRDILPLLSENCFKCHGPDEARRESDLRLDRHATAIARLDSGQTAVVPGESSQSELFKRIATSDSDLKMPPPDSGKKLTAGQIQLIRKWLDDGAEWSGHWAFLPPKKPSPPESF